MDHQDPFNVFNPSSPQSGLTSSIWNSPPAPTGSDMRDDIRQISTRDLMGPNTTPVGNSRVQGGNMAGMTSPLATDLSTLSMDTHHWPRHEVHVQPGSGEEGIKVMVNQDILDNSYAFFIDRGNGQVSRLIPADMLPPLRDIRATEPAAAGMAVLCQPSGRPPRGEPAMSSPVLLQNLQNLAGDAHWATGRYGHPFSDEVQKRIDSIVATSSSANPPKKTKIWCDKWIHDGICAFTQQGCKFKHEMPLDKATQFSVGLFHGLPNWYKKQQSEMATVRRIQDLNDDNHDGFDRPIVMPGDAHRRIGRHMPTDSGFGMVSPEAGSRSGPSGWRRFGTQHGQGDATNVSRPRTIESAFPLSPGQALSTPAHSGIMTRYTQLPTPCPSSPPRQDFGPIGTPRRQRPTSGYSAEGFPATLNYDDPQSPAGKEEDVDAKFYPMSEHTAVKSCDKTGGQ